MNMENKDNIVISKYAFERMQAKDEMNDRWRNIIIIILIILLVVTNAMWLVAWNQYDYVDGYVEIDTGEGGDANYIGNDGDISYGTDYSSQEIEGAS
jgi:hypothetical protein